MKHTIRMELVAYCSMETSGPIIRSVPTISSHIKPQKASLHLQPPLPEIPFPRDQGDITRTNKAHLPHGVDGLLFRGGLGPHQQPEGLLDFQKFLQELRGGSDKRYEYAKFAATCPLLGKQQGNGYPAL